MYPKGLIIEKQQTPKISCDCSFQVIHQVWQRYNKRRLEFTFCIKDPCLTVQGVWRDAGGKSVTLAVNLHNVPYTILSYNLCNVLTVTVFFLLLLSFTILVLSHFQDFLCLKNIVIVMPRKPSRGINFSSLPPTNRTPGRVNEGVL